MASTQNVLADVCLHSPYKESVHYAVIRFLVKAKSELETAKEIRLVPNEWCVIPWLFLANMSSIKASIQ